MDLDDTATEQIYIYIQQNMKGIVIPCDEATPLHLITVYSVDDIYRHILRTSAESEDRISSLLLIRPRIQSKQAHNDPSMISSSVQSSHDLSYPGLYVYYEVSPHLHNHHHHHHPVKPSMEDECSNNHQNNDSLDLTFASIPNIRATRFAMACGHWSVRLYGTVVLCTDGTVLLREENKIFCKNSPTAIQEQMKGTHADDSIVTTLFSEIVTGACHQCSPDLRNYFLLPKSVPSSATTTTISSAQQQQQPSGSISDWIGNAAQEQYHDVAVLNRLHSVMTSPHHDLEDDNDDDDNDNTDNDATAVVHIQQRSNHSGHQCDKRTEMVSSIPPTSMSQKVITTTVTTKLPLCYHCRKPAFTLCHQCNGVYFCDTNCQRQGYVSKNCPLVFVGRRNLVVAHNSIFQSVMYTSSGHYYNSQRSDTRMAFCSLSLTTSMFLIYFLWSPLRTQPKITL
jgi:hypothetical protein